MHTLLPREPDCGNNTIPALDADTTDLIKRAEIAHDALTAYDAVYNDPDPNGYTDNILIFYR